MTPSFWYLAQTKPRQEQVAFRNLERQGFTVSLPIIPRIKRSPRLPPTEVLFPGYIFFAPSSQSQSISPVRSTLGIARVVFFGQQVATLSAAVFAEILRFIEDRSQSPGGLAAHINRLQKGASVRITDGPFVGLEGLVSGVGQDRVMVLLEIMGKTQKLAFAPASVIRS
ncbi:MAG: transcription termination/antitermination protein NusG [Burkholderiaceae bacterium]